MKSIKRVNTRLIPHEPWAFKVLLIVTSVVLCFLLSLAHAKNPAQLAQQIGANYNQYIFEQHLGLIQLEQSEQKYAYYCELCGLLGRNLNQDLNAQRDFQEQYGYNDPEIPVQISKDNRYIYFEAIDLNGTIIRQPL